MRHSWLLIAMLSLSMILLAQDHHTAIQLLSGRTGKPLKHEKLLLFVGDSLTAVRGHGNHASLVTNQNGLADLDVSDPAMQWIQVFPEGEVLCQRNPNEQAFSIKKIVSAGLVSENTCGSPTLTPVPERLVVFARSASFVEQMQR